MKVILFLTLSYEKMDRDYYSHAFLVVYGLVNSLQFFHTVARNRDCEWHRGGKNC